MEDLYQEKFFKNSPAVTPIEQPFVNKVTPATISENLDVRSQFFFFFRLLKEDVLKQSGHCKHIQLTIEKLEKAAQLDKSEDFLNLLDLLEDFLDVEYLK